jgi:hypothetical protein
MYTKPVIYTTEFWTMVAGVVLNFVNVADIWNWASNWHSGILMTALIAVYNVARGQAKSGVGADPAVPGNYKLFPRLRDMTRHSRT